MRATCSGIGMVFHSFLAHRRYETKGSAIQISGWKDPFKTDTRLTRNILSMCMKPLPILHLSSTDSSGVTLYDMLMSNHEANVIVIRMYSHKVEVLLEFLGNFIGQFAPGYWLIIPSPVQCIDLWPCGQHVVV